MFNDLQSFKLQQYTFCEHGSYSCPAHKTSCKTRLNRWVRCFHHTVGTGTWFLRNSEQTGKLGQETKTRGIFLVIVQHQSYLYVPWFATQATMLLPKGLWKLSFEPTGSRVVAFSLNPPLLPHKDQAPRANWNPTSKMGTWKGSPTMLYFLMQADQWPRYGDKKRCCQQSLFCKSAEAHLSKKSKQREPSNSLFPHMVECSYILAVFLPICLAALNLSQVSEGTGVCQFTCSSMHQQISMILLATSCRTLIPSPSIQ